MTPILLLLAFLLVVDVLVLLGHSHDSRDGQDWQPRGSTSPGRRPLRPSDGQTAVESTRHGGRLATESEPVKPALRLWSLAVGKSRRAPMARAKEMQTRGRRSLEGAG